MNDEEASLTIEDKRDIEEIREEDRRSNIESMGRRTRNRGNEPLLQGQELGSESEDSSLDGDSSLDDESEEDS